MQWTRGLVLVTGMVLASFSGAAPSLAATVNVSFGGKINFIDDPHGLTTYGLNDAISGSLTIGPLGDAPTTTTPGQGSVYQSTATFSFASIVDSGQGSLTSQNLGGSIGYFLINFDSPITTLVIDFAVDNPTLVPLQSLADLPKDLDGLLSYLGGSLMNSNATFITGTDPTHQVGIDFTLDSLTFTVSPPIAATPIPGSLLLFLTALGGVVVLQVKRRGTPLSA